MARPGVESHRKLRRYIPSRDFAWRAWWTLWHALQRLRSKCPTRTGVIRALSQRWQRERRQAGWFRVGRLGVREGPRGRDGCPIDAVSDTRSVTVVDHHG